MPLDVYADVSVSRYIFIWWVTLLTPEGRTSIYRVQIPKPNQDEGLGIGWPAKETDMEKLKALHNEIKAKI